MPMERAGHAATLCTPQLGLHGTLLLMLGGRPNHDCWICSVQGVRWKRVSVALMEERERGREKERKRERERVREIDRERECRVISNTHTLRLYERVDVHLLEV